MPVRSMGTIFPEKMITYLRSQHSFRYTATLASLDGVYGLYYGNINVMLHNSIYEPLLISGQVVQPQFYDLLAERYDKYLVKWCKYKLHIVSRDKDNDYQICHWIPNAGNTAVTSWDMLELQPSCQKRLLRASGNNGDKFTLVGFVNPNRYMSLVDYNNKFANMGNSPNTKIYSYIFAMNMTTTNNTCDIYVKVNLLQKCILGTANTVPDST